MLGITRSELLKSMLPDILDSIRYGILRVTLVTPVTNRGKRLSVTGKHLEQPIMDLIGYLQAKEILNVIHERNMVVPPKVSTDTPASNGTPLDKIKAARPETPKFNGVTLDYHPDWIPDQSTVIQSNKVCCVGCGTEIESMINTIRARVLKGTIQQLVDGLPDPTTDLPVQKYRLIPTYDTGRLCRVCQSTMTATKAILVDGELVYNPPRQGQFEYLHEHVKPRKRHVVTVGAIKADAIIERKEREAPKYWDLGDILVEAPPEAPEPIHAGGFNKYGLNRSGGIGSQHRTTWDEAFNKDNSSVKK